MNEVLLSSRSNEWETPQDFFDRLNKAFHFTLDPCCTHDNAKCEKHYTKNEDGLIQDWSKEIVFMNPPYGRQIGKWIKKAYEESKKGATIVCLIPSRTDTNYWHDYCMKGDIYFIRGRLHFNNADRAPFPSAVVVFWG